MLRDVATLLGLCFIFNGANIIGTTSSTRLSHSAILDADNKYHLAWDFDDQYIAFEVSVETRGYIGLGFSPNGGMAGSDIVIGWVDDSTGKGEISDRHSPDQSEPLVDERQDYSLLHSYQNDTHTVLRFRRKVDLCGDEDHNIKDETVRVIWAYNVADPTPGGAMAYHGTNRGNKNMYLLNPQRNMPTLPANVIYEDFLNPNVTIPTHHTTYWCSSFPAPRLDRKHHVIKMEPIIQPGHQSEVHHIILWACYHPVRNESFYKGYQCRLPNMPDDFQGCTSAFLFWAVGGGPHYFPENVGLPLGHDGDPTMLVLETHYDNPTGKEGLIDSSGFRLTLTPELREYDAGVFEIGEDVGPSQIIPPFSQTFRTSGNCFPECLSQAMETPPHRISVFGVALHTHLLGRAVRVRHFRQGIEQSVLMQDNNFDFNYQDNRMLKKEVEIFRGDHFVVECDYNSTARTNVTHGGLSTRDEMCLAFLYHYPALKLGYCMSTPTPQYQATFLNLTISDNKTIISPGRYSGRALFDVLDEEVDWSNKTFSNRYQQLLIQEGVDGFRVRCDRGKLKYDIHGQVRPLPRKISTLPTTFQTCDSFRAEITGLFLLVQIISVLMANIY